MNSQEDWVEDFKKQVAYDREEDRLPPAVLPKEQTINNFMTALRFFVDGPKHDRLPTGKNYKKLKEALNNLI